MSKNQMLALVKDILSLKKWEREMQVSEYLVRTLDALHALQRQERKSELFCQCYNDIAQELACDNTDLEKIRELLFKHYDDLNDLICSTHMTPLSRKIKEVRDDHKVSDLVWDISKKISDKEGSLDSLLIESIELRKKS